MKKAYLDYGSTTPVHPKVMEAMLPFFTEHFGNASAIHAFGVRARAAVEEARSRAARFLGAGEDEQSIIFTGSGTESNSLAILGYSMHVLPGRPHIITSAVEHASVINTCRFLESLGAEVTYLPVDGGGSVSPEQVEKAVRTTTALISIQYANNEIGTIQPVRDIADIAERHGVVFHTDAVQAFGKLPLNAPAEKITLLSASAHKIYGPKGVGLLFIDRRTLCERLRRLLPGGAPFPEPLLRPLMFGGHQEEGLRPSTENVPGIAGFSKAIEISEEALTSEAERLTVLRDYCIHNLLKTFPGARLNGPGDRRLPGNISMCFPGFNAYELMLVLDRHGIACSSGSACSAASTEPSHVLTAIGLCARDARSALRFTLGLYTTRAEIDFFLAALFETIREVQSLQ